MIHPNHIAVGPHLGTHRMTQAWISVDNAIGIAARNSDCIGWAMISRHELGKRTRREIMQVIENKKRLVFKQNIMALITSSHCPW